MKKIAIVLLPLLLSSCSLLDLKIKNNNTSDSEEAYVSFYKKHQLKLTKEASDFIASTTDGSYVLQQTRILISFVQEDCWSCKAQYTYIKNYLETDSNFYYYVIFADEKDSNGDSYELFKKFHKDNSSFFKSVQEAYDNSDYAGKSMEDPLNVTDVEEFVTPTNVFLDFSVNAPAWTTKPYHASEACHSFTSEQAVSDMIHHTGIFRW